MNRFEFSLSISPQDYIQYYRGSISQVLARCTDGTSIQFPALLLKPFVTSAGIRGKFILCDAHGKGSEIQRAV